MDYVWFVAVIVIVIVVIVELWNYLDPLCVKKGGGCGVEGKWVCSVL